MFRQYISILTVLVLFWIPEHWFLMYDRPYISLSLLLVTYTGLALITYDLAAFIRKKSKQKFRFKAPLVLILIHYSILFLFFLYLIFNQGTSDSTRLFDVVIGFASLGSFIVLIVGHFIFGIRMYKLGPLKIQSLIFIAVPIFVFTVMLIETFLLGMFGAIAMVSDLAYTILLLSVLSVYISYQYTDIDEVSNDDILDF